MSRLVLDTNCLIQIISSKSKYHCLRDNFMNGKDTLCISNEILEEYVEILQKLIGIDILKEIEFPKVYAVNLIDYIKTFCKPEN